MKKRQGQTLIEVAVATLVTAMASTAVFSVVLAGSVSSVKSDKREAAAMVLKRAQETLKNYVSAVPAEAAYVPNNGKWGADASGGWALNPGVHDISSLLKNTPLQDAANSATFKYTVTDDNNCVKAAGDKPCKIVTFNLNYPS